MKGSQINLPAIHSMVRKWYIFRSKVCIMTLWKASSDDVWYTGDNLHMSLQSWEFVNKAESFSLAFESKRTQTTTTKKHVVCVVISEHAMSCYSHLRLFNHFFFLSWPFNLPCAHLGNFLFVCLCLLWIWLSRDNHLASMVLLSPSGVKETHQYRCQFNWAYSPMPVPNDSTVLLLCCSF